MMGIAVIGLLGILAGRPWTLRRGGGRERERRQWEQAYERRPQRWFYDLPRPFGPIRLSLDGSILVVDCGPFLVHHEVDLIRLQQLSLRCGDEVVASARVRSGVRFQGPALTTAANELHRLIVVRQLRPLGQLFGLAELVLQTDDADGEPLVIPFSGPAGWEVASEWFLRLQTAIGEAASPVSIVPQPYSLPR